MQKRTKLGLAWAGLLLCVFLVGQIVPPQHIVWKPLDVEAPIGLATGSKITLIALGPSRACFDKLDSAESLTYVVATPKRGHKTCGWTKAAIMQEAAGTSFRPTDITAQCPLVLASYIWLKNIDKQAQDILGSGLSKVHHAGTYSCRRQRGNGSGAWSEHAFANAWDITGFELKDGRVISVQKHWNGTDKDKRKFLRKSRNAACHLFRVVLSPDYNAAHADHLHLDQGPSLSCR